MFWVRSDLDSGKRIRAFNFWRGGVFWVRSDLDFGKKIRVFNFWRGLFWVRSDLESVKKIRVFNFWGWIRSDLDSGENFNWGMCSGTKFQNRGVIGNLVKNFWKPSLLAHHR